MDVDVVGLLYSIAVYALPMLLAITVHEVAHGYVARYWGDKTAAAQGRLTLNPFAHIDLVGTILLPLMLLLLTKGAFVFGFAKPVPVNIANLRKPKRDMVWVALAGPFSNVLQAVIWTLLSVVLGVSGISEPFLYELCIAGILVNLVLCMLNLFPLPPLDGGRVVTGLLPYKLARPYAQLEPYGFLIVLVLLYANIISDYWVLPLVSIGSEILGWIQLSLLSLTL